MKKQQYIALSASGIFLILCATSFAFFWSRPQDQFSAMFIGALTMPWSLGFGLIKDLIIGGVFNYEVGFLGKNVMLLVGAFINSFLIYFFITRIKR